MPFMLASSTPFLVRLQILRGDIGRKYIAEFAVQPGVGWCQLNCFCGFLFRLLAVYCALHKVSDQEPYVLPSRHYRFRLPF